jgi:hypothetical protein
MEKEGLITVDEVAEEIVRVYDALRAAPNVALNVNTRPLDLLILAKDIVLEVARLNS